MTVLRAGNLIFMFWLKPPKSKQCRAFRRRAVVIVAVSFLAPTVAGTAAAILFLGGF